MTVIINDEGFSTPEQEITYERADTLNKETRALDISADQDLNALSDYLDTLTLIRIEFACFADGRGFSLARILRLMGFSGHLRAYGHVIADQYAMARRSGFDDVEVPKALATRQPEAEWLFRSNWSAHDYQTRLRKSA